MPYFRSGDVKLHYQDEGQGEALLFLHGFTCDHRMWQAQLQFFSSNFRVLVLDSRGHGKSEAPETGYSRDHRVEDTKLLLEELKIDKVHLVGLSMGGSTAIGFALKYTERLKSMVLVSTGAAGHSPGKKIGILDEIALTKGINAAKEKWLEWILVWFNKRDPEIGRLIRKMVNDHSGAIWIDPMRGKYPRTIDVENAHKIKARTLIVAGQLDHLFVELSEKLHQEIKNSQLILLENAGHMLNLEYPAEFNAELSNFLKSLGQKKETKSL